MSEWIDVSVTIRDGMVHWPDNPPISVERVLPNVSKISMGVHTGTHVDAPVHFDPKGIGIDKVPLAAMCGPARVIAIRNKREITARDLASVRAGERILLKTKNSPAAWKRSPRFVDDAVHLTTEAARHLAARKVMTVGIDYLSVAGYRAGNGKDVHVALIGAGVTIIEGLDLSKVPAGPCDLVCLPLKIAGCDGGPARAIVRPKRRSR